eukprot:scaffold5185_cov198-Alexandrium_tamarense.AAC.42
MMLQQLTLITAAYSTNAFANAPAFALPPKSALVRQDISYHQYFRHISHDRLQYMCVPSEYDEAPHSKYNEEDYSTGDIQSTPISSQFAMGASIGSENVGEMLFNEELLKSGRGDVRIGSAGKWKDFRGNEIIQNSDPN